MTVPASPTRLHRYAGRHIRPRRAVLGDAASRSPQRALRACPKPGTRPITRDCSDPPLGSARPAGGIRRTRVRAYIRTKTRTHAPRLSTVKSPSDLHMLQSNSLSSPPEQIWPLRVLSVSPSIPVLFVGIVSAPVRAHWTAGLRGAAVPRA